MRPRPMLQRFVTQQPFLAAALMQPDRQAARARGPLTLFGAPLLQGSSDPQAPRGSAPAGHSLQRQMPVGHAVLLLLLRLGKSLGAAVACMPKKKAQEQAKPAGQRAINSFFNRKKPSAPQLQPADDGPSPGQPQPQDQHAKAAAAVIDLGTDDDPPAEQPRKRARYFEAQGSAEEAVPTPAASSSKAAAGLASFSRGMHAPGPGPQAAGSRSAPAAAGSTAQAQRKPAPLPADMHQRFQNKLVLGVGNRKAGRDKDDIVPQKHTPLELQVGQEARRRAAWCIGNGHLSQAIMRL